MSWTPKIGMKVVCINNSHHSTFWGRIPSVGEVYTIDGVKDDVPESFGIFLTLAEYPETNPPTGRRFGYRKDRFRPLIKRKTDIEQFRKLLNALPSEKEEA